jgi:hypothetical protein
MGASYRVARTAGIALKKETKKPPVLRKAVSFIFLKSLFLFHQRNDIPNTCKRHEV